MVSRDNTPVTRPEMLVVMATRAREAAAGLATKTDISTADIAEIMKQIEYNPFAPEIPPLDNEFAEGLFQGLFTGMVSKACSPEWSLPSPSTYSSPASRTRGLARKNSNMTLSIPRADRAREDDTKHDREQAVRTSLKASISAADQLLRSERRQHSS